MAGCTAVAQILVSPINTGTKLDQNSLTRNSTT
jgi:hypothetical protein